MCSNHAQISQETPKWWTDSRRRVFYDAHTPDFQDPYQLKDVPDPDFPLLRDADPQADLESMHRAHVDSVVLYAKCQYGNAYYPTEVGHQHSALEGTDLFGDQVEAAHERDMRVIAYFSNMWDVHAATKHPEWKLVPHPARGPSGRWPALCLRSPYRKYALDQAAEIARRYPIDAFWSDILTAGPCVCQTCADVFRERTGLEIPTKREDPHWVDLIKFSGDTIEEYLEEQRQVLKSEREHVALIPNFFGTTFTDAVLGLRVGHLHLADIGSSEGYTDWHGLGFPSYAANYIDNGVLGRPREVLVSRFVHTWDSTLRSEAQMRYEAFTVAANGATVSLDDQPTASGALVKEVYDILGPVYQRIKEREPWLIGAEPVRHVGIYASQRMRALDSHLGGPEAAPLGEQSAQFPPSNRHPHRSDLDAALAGTYRAMVEEHLPVTFVDERPASLDKLDDLDVLVLPDAFSLSDAEITRITDFVERGGGLVVTGECATLTEDGQPELSSAARELLGVEFGAWDEPPLYPYVQPTDREVSPIPHYGPIPRLKLTEDAKTLAVLTLPIFDTTEDLYWHNNQPAPGRQTDQAVIVERKLGEGTVIVSGARLGNAHARLGHSQYRELLASLVRRASQANPPVRLIGGSPNTELVLGRSGESLVVHLVSGAATPRLTVVDALQPAAVESISRQPSMTIEVEEPYSTAHRVVDGDLVPLSIEDNRVTLVDCDDWETVVLS